MKNILLVDDDIDYGKKFKDFFSSAYKINIIKNESDFYSFFNPYNYDIIVLDIRLEKGEEGLKILKYIKEENPYLPVIMLTGYDSTEYYTQSVSYGADAYLNKKNFSFHAIRKVFDTILDKNSLKRRILNLEQRIEQLEPTDIIGKSEKIKEIQEKIKVAALDGKITVLIRGETGVGKELVARNIHQLGVRKTNPYVTMMIGGIPKDILYSELFGHEKGSFTGALNKRRGFIEEAHRGILFLDEIGELDKEAQIKLLRVIEEQKFFRLGSSRSIDIDVQFITATNQNLEDMIKNKSFRKDLYFRLKAFEIFIPPLRKRKEDIPLLIDYFVDNMLKKQRSSVEAIDSSILDILYDYDWPGNVRELKNIIESLCTYARFKNKIVIDKTFTPFLEGIMMKELDNGKDKSAIDGQFNYKKRLAYAEIELAEDALKRYGDISLSDLAKKLRYNDRQILTRRIKNHFRDFKELKEIFPAVHSRFFPKSFNFNKQQ